MKKIKIIIVILSILLTSRLQAGEIGEIDIHGFISQGYLKSSDNNFLNAQTKDGTFEFNEMGINFSTWVTSELSIGMQIFASDLGVIGNDKVILDWAIADFHWEDWLGIRIGKMRAPAGLYNETRDIDMLRTGIFLPQTFYLEAFREPSVSVKGLSLYGSIPLYLSGDLSYQLLYGTLEVDPGSGSARSIEGSIFEAFAKVDVDEFEIDYRFIGVLEWHTPLEGFRIKGQYAAIEMTTHMVYLEDVPFPPPPKSAGDPLDPPLSIEMIAKQVSVEYTWEDLVIAVEYMQQIRTGTSRGDNVAPSYYGSASYRFTGWFELGVAYGELYSDEDDKDGEIKYPGEEFRAWLKDAQLSLRFDINSNWLFKIEGHLMDGAASLNQFDHPDGYEQKWNLFAAKLSCMF